MASAEAAQPFPGEPAAYLPGKLATMLSDARSRLLVCSAHDVDRFSRTRLVSRLRAFFPPATGGREAKFREEQSADGIGLTLKIAQGLQEIGDRLGVDFPWERLPPHPDAKHAPPTAKI